jgi:signal transduction histidine kinase
MQSQSKLIPKISGLLVVIIGMLALTGWLFDILVLKSILPDLISMKVNTSLCFVLSGITLLLLGKENLSYKHKVIVICFSFFTLIVGSFSLSEYIFDVNFGIDEFLFKDDIVPVATSYPGRMSPNTAISFIFISLAFLFQSRKFWIAQTATFLALAIAFLALIGYIYNVPYLISYISPTQMAVHTTVAFLLLGIGILFSRSEKGFIAVIQSQNSGGTMARPLIIFAIIGPLAIGWIRLQAQYVALIKSTELGVAFWVISMTTSLIVIIWRNARSLNHNDLEKEKAKKELADLNLALESKVIERTKYLEDARKEMDKLVNELSFQNLQLVDFSNIISHNLKGPIANITLLVDYIQESEGEAEQKEILEKIKLVTGHLKEVFNELVETLQVKQDTEIESSKIILKDCLNNILIGFEGEIKSYKADIQIDFKEAPEIYYPQKYIDSILTNLISNALKYKSPDRKPVIKIKTEKIDGKVVLSVADNGLGIDLGKYKDQIFKIRKVFHKHPDAKGFGLFMTKTQVETMGGKIWVESAPNVGSTFFVEFKE